MSLKSLKLVLIGETGVGKSQLGNFILKSQNCFKVGHSMDSETTKIKEAKSNIEGCDITIVDTPGFGDTRDNNSTIDDQNINNIVSYFKKKNNIDGILFVDSYSNPRKGEKAKELIDQLKTIFNKEILELRLKVIFTSGEDYEYEPEKVNKIISDTKKSLGGIVTKDDIIFVNTLYIDAKIKKNYPKIKGILDEFIKIKEKYGSMNNQKINSPKKKKKKKKNEDRKKEIVDQINAAKKEINLLEQQIKDDNNAIAASSVFVPFTLGFSGFGIAHCMNSKKRHEKDLQLEKERLNKLEGILEGIRMLEE
jgi:GTP-binding protein EngB required for normal cell division